LPQKVLAIDAWNTERGNSFDCKANAELYRYFIQQEPIPALLLVDRGAEWNLELENVYLVSRHADDAIEHYEYELRPDCEPMS
jgi:hypothetical protein